MNDFTILGFDIGGANIKVVKLKFVRNKREIEVLREYFPLWLKGRNDLENKLQELRSKLLPDEDNYIIITCMTAELCDIYDDKSDGVLHVVNSVENVFYDSKGNYYVNVHGKLITYDDVVNNPLQIAAANWAASVWLIERLCKNCILIDIGSTTTTIIPVINGKAHILGFNDPDKIKYGEILYIGTLRTNIVEFIDKVPYKGFLIDICRERFSTIADVHLILGNISENEYTTETADGKGKSFEECIRRLCRIVCSSTELMNIYEVIELARYIYEVQLFKLTQVVYQIRSRIASMGINPDEFILVSAGIGEFIVKEIGRRIKFKKVVSIDDLVKEPVKIAPVLPSYAAALMGYEYYVKNLK